MTRWTFTLRATPPQAIGANAIGLAAVRQMSVAEIEQLELAGRGERLRIGDLFNVTRQDLPPGARDQLVVEGDLRNVHDLAASHRDGDFTIVGPAGNGVGRDLVSGSVWLRGDGGDELGAGMRGGTIRVDGNVGRFVAAAHGSSAAGMRGGQIVVAGSAGDYAGHRMRRGVLVIDGSAGQMLASQMIAGTIAVSGTIGAYAAYAIRRGTLVLPELEGLCPRRFTPASENGSVFATLLARSLQQSLRSASAAGELLSRLAANGMAVRRGDLAVRGQAEIVSPLR